jgi:hypothetical protein
MVAVAVAASVAADSAAVDLAGAVFVEAEWDSVVALSDSAAPELAAQDSVAARLDSVELDSHPASVVRALASADPALPDGAALHGVAVVGAVPDGVAAAGVGDRASRSASG